MSKRFTDTEKWRDPWFCALSNDNKLFWIFLCDTCDFSGLWKVNWPLVSFYIPGFTFSEATFAGRIQKLNDDKWWIRKFTDFQYGELSPKTNRLHQRIAFELEKEGVSIPSRYPSVGVQVQEQEKRVVSLLGKSENLFADFWKAYPRKKSKGDAMKAWKKLNPSSELHSQIMRALERATTSADWVKDGGQFVPYPATWLNAQGWEDEIGVPTPKSVDKTPVLT